jgi:hypothetical protein
MPDLDRPIVGRGIAIGDYDNDGRVDAMVVDSEGEVILLHNETPKTGHWLTLRLSGHRCNRDAYGADVTIDTGKRKLFRHCHADGSYLSSSDPRIHFGLGDDDKGQRIIVHWPGGADQVMENIPAGRILTIEEGQASK